jgi:nucleotide-binding universal stress UspA family protein
MFERILVPLDGSLRAELILGQIGRVLLRENSKILLLRVVPPGGELKEAQAYIDDLVRRYAGRGARVDGRVAEGSIAETVLRVAEAEGATMIAMSTHGRSGLSRWLVGSVAEKVVRASGMPVLLVRSFREGPGGSLAPATAEEIPFRKILVATDGSPAAAAAAVPARKFAELFSSEVLVLHAEFPLLLPGPELGTFPAAVATPAGKDEATEETAGVFRDAQLRVKRLTELGDPAGVILDQSRAAGVDLIAMATHGRSGFSRWVMGSVAERVLRHASVPILLVPAGKAKRE